MLKLKMKQLFRITWFVAVTAEICSCACVLSRFLELILRV